MRNTAAVFAIAVNVGHLFCRFAADYRCHKERVANQREQTISFAHTADWVLNSEWISEDLVGFVAAAAAAGDEGGWVIILLQETSSKK